MEMGHSKVYSFDIFDTLIARSTATPHGIFAIMRELLQEHGEINNFVKNNFCELRIGAEQVARNTYCKNGLEDVVLEQIYHVLVLENLISEQEAVFLQALERQTEIDNVYGIEENICRVKRLLDDGEKVLLISDMYLDADTIRRMLVKVDDIFRDIPLFVSSEGERKNKYSGNLFRWIKEREGLQYENWRHFGDNAHSDFRVPEQLGISCELYKREKLLNIEKAYVEHNQNDAQKQLMVGCARLARGQAEGIAYDLGCGIGGVMLYPYVRWLLEDAEKRGIKRLYFIARDGYILKEMAEELVRSKRPGIMIKYIYGSRKAWRIPDSINLESEVLDIYAKSFQDRIFQVADLADFLQIPEEELRKYMPDGLCDGKKRWKVSNVDSILRYLLRLPEFTALLREVYSQKKRLLVAYLQQEVDTSDENFAFVDLAGSGYTQECLAKVMKQFCSGRVKNYFYRRDCAQGAECEYFVFYPMFVPYYTLLEMMCRAPHEQTTGYMEGEDGTVNPVFAKVDGEAIVRHGVKEFIRGAVEFAKIYDKALTRYPTLDNGLDHIGKYFEYMFYTPDGELLDYLGDIPNMLTGREKQTMSFAPKLTDQEIRKIYWYREWEAAECYYKGSDLNYSVQRCTEKQKRKIDWYVKYHDSWYGRACRKIYRAICHETPGKMVCAHDYMANTIAIYGAGKVGRRFYRQITGKEKVQGVRYHSQVVLWLGQNYEECQKEGLPVSDPKDALRREYEQLIIAVAKKEVADSIREMLVQLGVDRHKILWMKELV